ncbi:MAG: CRISPR-associated endonuclease Cas2, partial [Bacteroidota bacterium]
MIYVIAIYDVASQRCGKMLKLCRRYLHWVQNSVFEGELTPSQYARLRQEVNELRQESDCVIFYQL